MMIKICGITREEDAAASADAGATAIGFNFYKGSPRFIAPKAAAEIGRSLHLLRVGVFVNEAPGEVEAIAREAALDIVQLHGEEPPTWTVDHFRVWKAFRVTQDWSPESVSAYNVEAILLDGPLPGSGTTFDWKQAQGLPQRLVLAGGLDEANVRAAIREVQPWGIDACSKLESAPGVKDHEKLRRFIEAAREEKI